MATDTAQNDQAQAATIGNADVRVQPLQTSADYATILGLISAVGLIIAAIAMGSGNADFINGPSFMIVILGTIAATSISYTWMELKHVPGIIGNTVIKHSRDPKVLAKTLIDIASVARQKGLLALSTIESELQKDPFLHRAVQLVTDGYSPEDVIRVIGQEIDALAERHRRAASIMRRASEIAPAMGLIGTLVGLVQMLAQLNDPSSIGPAMAVALLTTFYGAILGTVILGPIAAKLERNSNFETMCKSIILTAMTSIARQENPRRLEMLLNSELPPEHRIRYFQ